MLSFTDAKFPNHKFCLSKMWNETIVIMAKINLLLDVLHRITNILRVLRTSYGLWYDICSTSILPHSSSIRNTDHPGDKLMSLQIFYQALLPLNHNNTWQFVYYFRLWSHLALEIWKIKEIGKTNQVLILSELTLPKW